MRYGAAMSRNSSFNGLIAPSAPSSASDPMWFWTRGNGWSKTQHSLAADLRLDVLRDAVTGELRGLRVVPLTRDASLDSGMVTELAELLPELASEAQGGRTSIPLPKSLQGRVDRLISERGRKRPGMAEGPDDFDRVVAALRDWAERQGVSPRVVVQSTFSVSANTAGRWLARVESLQP